MMRGGRRCGRHDVVVHINALPRFVDSGVKSANSSADFSVPDPTGPRFGLIVSTSVGNAVVRHRVARQLRHIAGTFTGGLHPDTDVVLRALPGAANATSKDLRHQIESAFLKLGIKDRGR